ncbi:tRNA isopentenyltransferase [Colletotrichum truncatum]|uniref:tRNA isopentenyltransferase n=1 Tax=Colletotrichum truncatum TaxID=5467 RepID=A0ACC3ZHL8_COLTU|nr:tRNA isopentenyltransferase [Colletotrichum truncatum]KAF6786621.1 tRNA isopentenyltransferase [Colletotrichum truncatum]
MIFRSVFSRRFIHNVVGNMTARNAPADPLVVILGSTGTGKSELAIELATRFKGEIINADAMQMYKGLPIITNKITTEERRGIPHHLLDHIGLDQPTWIIEDFKREANKVIREIRSRGNLPIVVGGTHYYTNALLFENTLVGAEDEKARDGEFKDDQDDAASFPILNEPTEVILAKLREVDPVMADRWHPNDRRKISRSLQIYLQHGRPASEIYAEQRQRKIADSKASDSGSASPWETLLFWVYSDPEVLKERLDKRVDKMLTAGLSAETQSMYEYVQAKQAAGEEVDYTRGIWQSIGFKEFEPYLRALNSPDQAADPTILESLEATGLEDMKTSTRQYAKYQTRWIRTKIVPLLQEQPSAMDHLFVMDSTDISQWSSNVIDTAVDIAGRFLKGENLPNPEGTSERAGNVLREAKGQTERTLCRRTCEICKTTCVTEQDWTKHVKSRRHNVLLKKTKRRALVAAERPMAVVPTQADGDVAEVAPAADRASSPEVDGLGIFDAPP